MQTNRRLYVYFCMCVWWESGLSCMLQQAIARSGAFLRNISDRAGLHYIVLRYMRQSNRHKIWLFLNWLIILEFASIEKSCVSRMEPNLSLSWVSGQLGYWTPFWLWKRFAQSFLMGASVPVAVLSAQGLVWIASFEFQHSYRPAMSNIWKMTACTCGGFSKT